MATLLNKTKQIKGTDTESESIADKISRHNKNVSRSVNVVDVPVKKQKAHQQQHQPPPKLLTHPQQHQPQLRSQQHHHHQAQNRRKFHIFNFFEVLHPPPMFTNFKDGFMHFMRTAVQHEQYIEGYLLKDATAKGKFPYLHYSSFNIKSTTFQHDPRWVRAIIEGHGNLQVHHQAAFQQIFAHCQSDNDWNPGMVKNAKDRVAYIVIVFKAEGNFDRLDETWQKWSGADFIYHHRPRELRLGRMILYKRCVPHGTFMYVFFCELKNGLMFFNSLLDLIERLNERSCGFASLYTIDELF